MHELPEGAVMREALRNLADSLAVSDPKAAADFALTLLTHDRRDNLLAQVAFSWVQSDLSAVVEGA